MPKVRKEKNRKAKKARYIRIKNMMRKYPECAYNGDFYCDHVYDPAYPWSWVDFRFFHSKLKRYYAVSMRTVAYEAFNDIEDRALDIAAIIFPDNDLAKRRDELMRKLIDEEVDKPIYARPRIFVKDYGSVSIGLWVTVNKEHIDEHVIREFIAFFRSLGEPIKPGWSWYGEETQVDCRKFL
jgi:hypothetical protein